MSRAVKILPAARRDLFDIAGYLAADNASVPQTFLANVEEALVHLAEYPAIGRQSEFPAPIGAVRIWPLRGFPSYLLFYKETKPELELLRVLHSARDLPRAFLEELGAED